MLLAQRKDFWELVDRAHKEGEKKGFTNSKISLTEERKSSTGVEVDVSCLRCTDYCFICQMMWRKVQSVHPALAEAGKFIDWKSYHLGRLQSEMRTEFKKSVYENSYAKSLGAT
jgi:hypothetical protein